MDIFTFQNLGNLLVLIFLQAVLGFDNLLYISIESKRAPKEHQSAVRKWGIIIAVVLRVVLLFVLMKLLNSLTQTIVNIDIPGIFSANITFAVIIFIFGGAFIMYTAVKEISHMLLVNDLGHSDADKKNTKSAAEVIGLIVFMNLIFSFDSILSAIAITEVFVVLAIAIITSGIAMLVVADKVADFLMKNRMYEVLGLFVLLIVGVVLLGEGGHKAHMELFGYEVQAMSKATFYFSISVLFVVEMIQSRYQKKLLKKSSLKTETKDFA